MVRKKTEIRYRTKRIKTRARHPKTHSIFGTFLGAYGLSLPFITNPPNHDSPISYIFGHPELDTKSKVSMITWCINQNTKRLLPEMLGYALAGALVSWIGKKYLGNTTQVSKHWRIM
jgi:hypothetical protein